MAINKEKTRALAQKLLQKGQVDKAIVEFQRLVDDDPSDVRTLLKIGDLYTRQGDKQNATATYGKVAQFYSDQGFFLKAVAVYKQILKLDPHLSDISLQLAELYAQLGLVSDAIGQFRQVAVHYEQQNRIDESIEILRRMVEIEPENVAIRIKLAETLAKRGNHGLARQAFEEVAEQLKTQSRVEDFVKVAERIIHYFPDDLATIQELSGIYIQRGDPRRALTKLQAAFQTDPNDSHTLTLLASAFEDLGQADKSLSVYRQLARIYKERQAVDALGKTLRKILHLAPNDAAATASLAELEPALASADAMEEIEADEIEVLADDIETVDDDGPQEDPYEKLLLESDVYIKYRLYDKALAHLQRILGTNSHHRGANERLKEVYLANDDTPSAIQTLLAMAGYAAHHHHKEQAIEDLQALLRLDGGHKKAREMLLGLGGEPPDVDHDHDDFSLEVDVDGEMPAEPEVHHEDDMHAAEIAQEMDDHSDSLTVEIDSEAAPHDDEEAIEVEVEAGFDSPFAESAETAAGDGAFELELEVGEPQSGEAPVEETTPLATDEPVIEVAAVPEIEVAVEPAVVATDEPTIDVAAVPEVEIAEEPAVVVTDEPAIEVAAPMVDEPEQPAFAPQARTASALSVDDLLGDALADIGIPPAPAATAAAPLIPEAPATPPDDPSEDIGEARFLLQQGLLEDAEAIVARLREEHGEHPEVEQLSADIEKAKTAGVDEPIIASGAQPEQSASEFFDDLQAELNDVSDNGEETEQVAFEDVFNAFKKGVAAAVDETDYGTHFELGIAYKEMGLLDDAVAEFALAKNSPDRQVTAQTLMGLCFLQKNQLSEALEHFKNGLDSGRANADESIDLQYEIGSTYNSMEKYQDAVRFYEKVYEADPRFRDVELRLEEARQLAQGVSLEEGVSNELDQLLEEITAGSKISFI